MSSAALVRINTKADSNANQARFRLDHIPKFLEHVNYYIPLDPRGMGLKAKDIKSSNVLISKCILPATGPYPT